MRLIGKVNGVDIILNLLSDNVYSTIIPRHITGVYIVELHLINDNGFIDTYSNIFVRIDFQNMIIRILNTDFTWIEGKISTYGYKETKTSFYWNDTSDYCEYMEIQQEYKNNDSKDISVEKEYKDTYYEYTEVQNKGLKYSFEYIEMNILYSWNENDIYTYQELQSIFSFVEV